VGGVLTRQLGPRRATLTPRASQPSPITRLTHSPPPPPHPNARRSQRCGRAGGAYGRRPRGWHRPPASSVILSVLCSQRRPYEACVQWLSDQGVAQPSAARPLNAVAEQRTYIPLKGDTSTRHTQTTNPDNTQHPIPSKLIPRRPDSPHRPRHTARAANLKSADSCSSVSPSVYRITMADNHLNCTVPPVRTAS